MLHRLYLFWWYRMPDAPYVCKYSIGPMSRDMYRSYCGHRMCCDSRVVLSPSSGKCAVRPRRALTVTICPCTMLLPSTPLLISIAVISLRVLGVGGRGDCPCMKTQL